MSLVRVNAPGWSVGDKVLSSQFNAMDINITSALDKRAGQTDTLASLVTLGGAGRIVQAPALGPNADTTWLSTGANRSVVLTAAINLDRTYSLGATGAVDGDSIIFYSDGTFVKTISVLDQSSVPIGGVGAASSTGSNWAEFVFRSGAWKQMRTAGGALAVVIDWTSDGVWNIPANALPYALAFGYGGGSGGGAGASSASTAGGGSTGGGGGAGSIASTLLLAVVPGSAQIITLGVGGNGGATVSGGAGSGGNQGTPTTIGALAAFAGVSEGGRGGVGHGATQVVGVHGGTPAGRTSFGSFLLDANTTALLRTDAAQGGYGASAALSTAIVINGGFNLTGSGLGGLQGFRGGGSVGGQDPGGAGGGGGAGPGGNGGNGGTGGDSVSTSGSARPGSAGTDAAPGSGGGGGGGGGAGRNADGFTGNSPGGAGGAGAGGFTRTVHFIP